MMEQKEILNFCVEKGILVDTEVLNLFDGVSDTDSIKKFIERLKEVTQKKMITKKIFEQNRDKLDQVFSSFNHENEESVMAIKNKLGIKGENFEERNKRSEKEDKNNNSSKFSEKSPVRVLSMPPARSKKLDVKDFVNHFRSRLNSLKKILQEHSELDNLVSINKISGQRQGISVIGIVYSKQVTKNKNLILEIEDVTGRIKVLVNQNKTELYEKAEEACLDSVIGVKGSGNKDIIFANEVVFPEALIQQRKKAPEEEYVLFLGDMHIGSKLFLEEEFNKFIDYLNGKFPDTPEVNKIKYVFIVGDIVAGVGIYPGQEKELEIDDVEAQYIKSAELLSKIRKDINIVLSPGNHDALRIMEPQPLLDEKYAWALYELDNVIMTGNPAMVNIGAKEGFSGFNILTYHGFSFHYYANNVSRLMKEKASHSPDKIMQYLLMHRHLAPSHASTLYFPSEDDALMIKDVPDIMLSGHTHKSAISYYNNILTVSCSSWESKTPFQEKMGNEPDFCKVPMMNLKSRAIKILDFEDYSKENWKVKI